MNQADEILSFIITKFNEIDAPIILMFGTMLHEFRNHTCLMKLIFVYDQMIEIKILMLLS